LKIMELRQRAQDKMGVSLTSENFMKSAWIRRDAISLMEKKDWCLDRGEIKWLKL
jgi:hypothetical protein